MKIQKGDWVIYNTKKYIVLWVYGNGYVEIREELNERNVEVVSIKHFESKKRTS
ncbi:hypothetical protein [Priestia aryabhattai]